MAEKIYVGKGKTGNFPDQIKIGIRYEQLTPNEKGYVNLIVSKLITQDQYGKTHTVYIDDWKPSQGGGGQQSPEEGLAF
jgi:predicted nucleic acid-binding OB-fold protein